MFLVQQTLVQNRSNLEWVPGRRQKASNKRSWACALENLESQKPKKIFGEFDGVPKASKKMKTATS